MRTVAGALIIAIVLFVAGALALGESRSMRRAAAEQQRLATLQYDADSAAESTTTWMDRLSLPFSTVPSADEQRASIDYWQARYQALTPLTGSGGERPSSDPNILLIAANATFRAGTAAATTRAAVDRLDSVMQAYADVLRADPSSADAAYNYEYVARLRDAIAKGRPINRAATQKTVALSDDLPVGPTLHGRPGGPPPEVPMADFKTFSPLQNDERGELMERQRQAVSRGKG